MLSGSASPAARRPTVAGDADAVTDAVLTASRLLVAVSARAIAVDESITLAQFRLLVVLPIRGALNLSMLADQLGTGLVSRVTNPASPREVVVALTEAGGGAVWQVMTRRRKEIARIVSRMPVRQRHGLVDALEAFVEASGEPPVSVHDGSTEWI